MPGQQRPASQARSGLTLGVALRSPAVVKLYDVFETTRHYLIVLERVSGGELFDYIIQRGHLPRREALRVLSQIVQGDTAATIAIASSSARGARQLVCGERICGVARSAPRPRSPSRTRTA